MYVEGVSAKTARRYSKKISRNKSFEFRVGFGAMFSACKTKEYSLKNSTIDNRLLFQELANIDIRTGAWLVSSSEQLVFEIPTQFTAEFWTTF